jgi:AraC-like DNA-binding protein
MKHEYSENKTNAYFAVQTFEAQRKVPDIINPHKWFSIFIIETGAGDLLIDDYRLRVDQPRAIFITPGQHLSFLRTAAYVGYSVSFNKEFYCIEYHDNDVSCNGLLFVNNYNSVCIDLDDQQLLIYTNTAREMLYELQNCDPLQAEMLKNLLKNLLIRSNRLFRTQNSIGEVDDSNIDFARKFSEAVEKNFMTVKQVEKYAELMGIAPASLTKKLQKFGIDSPSRIIRGRVVTEAKRLLMYTNKSVKEIASIIGYEDQYYFSRLFTKEAGISPRDYRKSLYIS